MPSGRDIDAGWLISAFGGILLVVAQFLDWYDIGISGWDAFETWDVVLAAIAVVVILAAVPALLPRDRVPLRLLGPAALGIVALHLVNPPPAATDSAPAVGAWLAFAGALALIAGGLLSRANVSIALQAETQPTRVADGRPER
mgnify:CR=1 FL=1